MGGAFCVQALPPSLVQIPGSPAQAAGTFTSVPHPIFSENPCPAPRIGSHPRQPSPITRRLRQLLDFCKIYDIVFKFSLLLFFLASLVRLPLRTPSTRLLPRTKDFLQLNDSSKFPFVLHPSPVKLSVPHRRLRHHPVHPESYPLSSISYTRSSEPPSATFSENQDQHSVRAEHHIP